MNNDLTLKVDKLISYLAHFGWSSKLTSEGYYIFTSPQDINQNSLKFILPQTTNKSFYDKDLMSIAEGIAGFRKVSLDEVWTDFATFKLSEMDSFKSSMNFRVDYKKANSIPINLARRIVNSLTACLEYSLSLELRKKFVVWEEKPASGVSTLLEKIHFDQTQRGSFIGKIVTEGSNLSVINDVILPIDHLALKRIAVGLDQLLTLDFKYLDQSSEKLLFTVLGGENQGLNSNMAFYLSKIYTKLAPSVDLNFNFHTDLRMRLEIEKTAFTINKEAKDKLFEYSKMLTQPIEQQVTLVGKPFGFTSQNPKEDTQLSLQIFTINDKPIHPKRMPLNVTLDQYKEAFDAHVNQKLIKINAITEIEKGKIRILQMNEFTVLD